MVVDSRREGKSFSIRVHESYDVTVRVTRAESDVCDGEKGEQNAVQGAGGLAEGSRARGHVRRFAARGNGVTGTVSPDTHGG